MEKGDYALGTDRTEIDRLTRQHELWRPYMEASFAKAGFGRGQTLIDVGAGPGLATADLSKIVGPEGKVIAFERSSSFLDVLRARELANIDIVEADVVVDEFGEAIADGAWTRFVLIFVSDPGKVVRNITRALKPGGVAVFHEFVDYEAWRALPDHPDQRRFLDLAVRSWRDGGGDPNVAARIPELCDEAGLDIVSFNPLVEIVKRSDRLWEWLEIFLRTNPTRLASLGYCSKEEAARLAALPDTLPGDAWMLMPVNAEIIARKR